VRIVTYQSLSAGVRIRLHKLVAQAMEAMQASDLEQVAMNLLHHYEKGHDLENALRLRSRFDLA
jgi:hypothetical protein